ncbi:hypothetical protein BI364_06830 [Acidihalobacter yilgarnensis]|uniref:Uncharacterized protein n=2 Tax=Acidihalobacter yilgarnensis TaxID=2819280 RepID=A0A1D8IML7_9GAMM|nr:hypothetical protein BI364_06830 [Acidihalobacter yilgarnensis]
MSGMPSVSQVLQKIRGKDRFDTTARQVGVFDQLTSILVTWSSQDLMETFAPKPEVGLELIRADPGKM